MLYPLRKYLPVEDLLYKTPLSKEQVIAQLTENMQQQKKKFGRSYANIYEGWISGDTFEVTRSISYRNSFLPVIRGEVFTDAEGTKIKIHMQPHAFTLAFMAIWLGGVFLVCIVMAASMFTKGFNPFFLIPFGMLLFGIALLYGAFKAEAAISKKDLRKIFETT